MKLSFRSADRELQNNRGVMRDDKKATPKLFVKVRVQTAVAGAIIGNDRMFVLFGEVNENGEVEIHMCVDEASAFATDIDMMVRDVWRKKNELMDDLEWPPID